MRKILLAQISNLLTSHQKDKQKIYIAYSGGMDSHVLLMLCSYLKEQFTFEVIHINHQLSENANEWKIHCQKECERFGFPFHSMDVSCKKDKIHSLESSAREQRFLAFSSILEKDDILLTAHHLDDQIETILYRLFRGAGIEGVQGMNVVVRSHHFWILRPFLEFTREKLSLIAKENNLEWIEDPSNQDTQFDRNYIRHDIIPAIKARWPSVDKTIIRHAQQCQDDYLLLKPLIENAVPIGSHTHCLSISGLKKLSIPLFNHVIRYWLDLQDLKKISSKHLEQIWKTIVFAREDATPKFSIPDLVICRYRDDLYAMSKLTESIQHACIWDPSTPLLLKNGGTLTCLRSEQSKTLVVEFGSVDFKIEFEFGHKSLKKCLQEWDVPPWERKNIPIILLDKEVIGVGNFWHKDNWEFDWEKADQI